MQQPWQYLGNVERAPTRRVASINTNPSGTYQQPLAGRKATMKKDTVDWHCYKKTEDTATTRVIGTARARLLTAIQQLQRGLFGRWDAQTLDVSSGTFSKRSPTRP